MLTALFWICLLYVSIEGLWTLGERLIYKKATPRIIDTVVAILLAVSLYFNFN